MNSNRPLLGFTCAYTPLPLIDAAGFAPYRALPMGQSPEQAGGYMHDNLCPHVKRILDRALANDLPELAGMIFINSCDAMRRLADAWIIPRPFDNMIHLDLPVYSDALSVEYFKGELERLTTALFDWSGKKITGNEINYSVTLYNQISNGLEVLGKTAASPAIQQIYNFASTHSFDETLSYLVEIESQTFKAGKGDVPVYLFGNVLPDPAAFTLFEESGVSVISEDLCTGSRLFRPMELGEKKEFLAPMSEALLSRPPCARTFFPDQPGKFAKDVLEAAKDSGAKGAICYTMKFCDPYLDRIPRIREFFKEADFPLLVLEGDCTLGSIGQQRTRIEAFVEMLR